MPPSVEPRNIVQLRPGVDGCPPPDPSRLRVVLDHIPEGMLTCDAHGRVDGMNAAAERIFGYAESQLLGARLDVVVSLLRNQQRGGGRRRHRSSRH